jgi:hypothetical protein
MMLSPGAMDTVLASLLRGETINLETLAAPAAEQRFVSVAAEHGVDCLVRHVMKAQGVWEAMPSSVRDTLDARTHAETAVELARRGELSRVLRHLGEVDVKALVLKGAGLAYTHYPAPYLRPCTDVDLLVSRSRDQRASAAAGLEALGYTRIDSMSREAVHTQTAFELQRGSARHIVDLHWAISNRPLFAAMLSFEELGRNAVALQGLGHGALTLGPVDALLFACIHRIAHHNDSQLLIWLFDIKLLAERLSAPEWEEFVELATRKQLVGVCRTSLDVTASLVGGCEEGLSRFARFDGSDRTPEPSAAYLGGIASRFRSLALDLKGVEGAVGKMRLLAGHAFPDPGYLRKKYGVTSRVGLVGAYAHRAAVGAWRTMRLPMARTRIAR